MAGQYSVHKLYFYLFINFDSISIHPFNYSSMHLSICLSIYLFIDQFTSLSILSIYPVFRYLTIYSSIPYLIIFSFTHLFIFPSIYLSIYVLYIFLPIYLSIFSYFSRRRLYQWKWRRLLFNFWLSISIFRITSLQVIKESFFYLITSLDFWVFVYSCCLIAWLKSKSNRNSSWMIWYNRIPHYEEGIRKK